MSDFVTEVRFGILGCANIAKKNEARPMIPPSCDTDDINVPSTNFIDGIDWYLYLL